MLQTFHDMSYFLLESFQIYSEDNLIWLLYPAALIVVLFLGEKKVRVLFLAPLFLEILTVFNPLIIRSLLNLFSLDNRYLRFFWMVPFFVTIAYAMVLLIFYFKNIFWNIGCGLLCIALILILGTPVFFGGDDVPPYRMVENDYFIENEILELSQIFHSEEIERPRVLYSGLMLIYRQYDPTVISLMPRAAFQYMQYHSYDIFMEEKADILPKSFTYRVFYYEDFSVDPGDFYENLMKFNPDYIVSSSPNLDEYLSGLPMTILGQTEHYRVWKVLDDTTE